MLCSWSRSTMPVRDFLFKVFFFFWYWTVPLATWNPMSSALIHWSDLLAPKHSVFSQPLDQRVIRIFKSYYTQYSMERKGFSMEENPDREDIMKIWKDYIIKDAIVVLEKAVKIIKPRTINSCWKKTVSRCCTWLHRICDKASQGNHERGCRYVKRREEMKGFKTWILEKFKN